VGNALGDFQRVAAADEADGAPQERDRRDPRRSWRQARRSSRISRKPCRRDSARQRTLALEYHDGGDVRAMAIKIDGSGLGFAARSRNRAKARSSRLVGIYWAVGLCGPDLRPNASASRTTSVKVPPTSIPTPPHTSSNPNVPSSETFHVYFDSVWLSILQPTIRNFGLPTKLWSGRRCDRATHSSELNRLSLPAAKKLFRSRSLTLHL